ncbi:hypothetical protein FF3_01495 [Fretibacterium fastidiosum]|uniref:hypothetical protein n=2 Tax=Fretibacterium fastidiosum TaxID=651822 RepID=UPI0038FBF3E8
MNFFEALDAAARRVPDCGVARLVLGWHASFALAEDGRWGVGFVPDSMKEAHRARAVHTEELIRAPLARLAGLYVSPFPQEFAAASAACAALLPFGAGGSPLDLAMTCARGDRVAVLGYERDLLPFMRDWGWRVAVFDDRGIGPDCFPQSDFSRGVREAEWVWLSPEAIRDRWLLSTREELTRKKGCFLQGPGLPALPGAFAPLGVTHLVVPRGDASPEAAMAAEAHVAAGGSPWLSGALTWRVYPAQGGGRRAANDPAESCGGGSGAPFVK